MRRTIVFLATATLAVALYVANVGWWLETEILDSDQFVETTLVAMEVDSTRDAAAEIIVDRLADEFPLLRLLDTALVSLFSDLLGSQAIRPLIVATATDAHQRLIEGDQSALIVDLDPYRRLLLAPLESLSPELAARVPDDWFRSVQVLDEGTLPDLSRYGERTEAAAAFAVIAAVALMVIVFVMARRWYSGFMAVGTAFVLGGGISALVGPGARSTADFFINDEPSSVLVTGIVDVFTQPLTTRSLAILAAGGLLFVLGLLGWLIDRDARAVRA